MTYHSFEADLEQCLAKRFFSCWLALDTQGFTARQHAYFAGLFICYRVTRVAETQHGTVFKRAGGAPRGLLNASQGQMRYGSNIVYNPLSQCDRCSYRIDYGTHAMAELQGMLRRDVRSHKQVTSQFVAQLILQRPNVHPLDVNVVQRFQR